MQMQAQMESQFTTWGWSGSRLASAMSHAWERFLSRRRLAATARILEGLDDRTLKDIGIDRSEISSVVATRCGGRRLKFDFDALLARG